MKSTKQIWIPIKGDEGIDRADQYLRKRNLRANCISTLRKLDKANRIAGTEMNIVNRQIHPERHIHPRHMRKVAS